MGCTRPDRDPARMELDVLRHDAGDVDQARRWVHDRLHIQQQRLAACRPRFLSRSRAWPPASNSAPSSRESWRASPSEVGWWYTKSRMIGPHACCPAIARAPAAIALTML